MCKSVNGIYICCVESLAIRIQSNPLQNAVRRKSKGLFHEVVCGLSSVVSLFVGSGGVSSCCFCSVNVLDRFALSRHSASVRPNACSLERFAATLGRDGPTLRSLSEFAKFRSLMPLIRQWAASRLLAGRTGCGIRGGAPDNGCAEVS